jgi:hypothetical protein
MSFRKGGEVAKKAAERTSFVRSLDWFSLEDGKTMALRFVTPIEEWITVQTHVSIAPVKSPPPGYEGNWPKGLTAVCRVATGEDDEGNLVRVFPQFPDCFICDHVKDPRKPDKPFPAKERTWGLAIVRKEILGPNGAPTGLEDEMVEVPDTEKGGDAKKLVPKMVKICMAYNNFWAGLVGVSSMRPSVCDIDYRVKREGKDINTTYQFAPYPEMNAYVPDDNGNPTETVAKLDLANPVFRKHYDIPSLEDIVTEAASDDLYAMFFDSRMAQPAREKSGTNAAPSEVPANTNDVSPEALAALANRVQGGVQGYGPQDAQAAQQPPQQPAQVGFAPS